MPDFTVRRGDTAPTVEAQLVNENNQPLDLSNVYRVEFEMQSGSKEIRGKCKVHDKENGEVEYQWSPGDTDVARRYEAHFIVEYRNGRKVTVPNNDDLSILVK